MRRFAVVCFCLVAVAGSARADDASPSQAACDSARIGARELADCLRTASEKSERDLAASLEAALKAIDAKPKMLSSQRTRWKRFLNDSQAQWTSLRDAECQDLAPFETGMAAKGGDPRLACIIDQDTRRAADLRARYSSAAPHATTE
jgi:uncharacterized protein YecT (DUF1311 family)